MKKEYIKPEMKAIEIQNEQFIATSSSPRMGVNGDTELPEDWDYD